MKGLTSIELAILLAIIIVIAVAVGWYMYTTLLASTSSSPTLQVVSATYYTDNGTLKIDVINPGPVNNVKISAVYLNGQSCGTPSPNVVPITTNNSTPTTITASCGTINVAAGTRLSGQLVTTAGATFLFTAVVAEKSQQGAGSQQGGK